MDSILGDGERELPVMCRDRDRDRDRLFGYDGLFSTIQRRGPLTMMTSLARCVVGLPPSARLSRCFRAGHGNRVVAATVNTAPAKVRAKREETRCRRWLLVTRM